MDLTVSHNLPEADVPTLAALYADTWFGEGREREGLRRMLAGTDATVVLYDGEDLVAFGHAITDGAFGAYLRDLVVAADYRGRGVGRRLVDELVDHPALADVDTVSLTCPEDLGQFYEKCGFRRREDGVVMNRSRSSPDG